MRMTKTSTRYKGNLAFNAIGSPYLNFWKSAVRTVPIFVALSFQAVALLFGNLQEVRIAAIVAYGAYSIAVLRKLRNKGTYIIALLCSSALMLLHYYLMAGQPENDLEKLQRVLLTMTMFGTVPALIFLHRETANRVPAALIGWSIILFFVLVLSSGTFGTGSTRRVIGESNPIWIARNLGLGAIAATYYLVTQSKFRAINVAILSMCIVGINLTGSRGPLLGYLAGFLTLILINFDLRLIAKIFLIAVVATLAIALSTVANLDIESRLVATSLQDDGRMELWQFAIDEIYLYPDGVGIGQFVYRGHYWPHNIFLEFIHEWGWLTGGTFIALILLGVSGIFMSDQFSFAKSLTMMELVNASLSGDVGSPRFLYSLVFVGLLFFVRLRVR